MDMSTLCTQWVTDMRARGLTAKTIQDRLRIINQVSQFLDNSDVTTWTRDDLKAWLADETWAPATREHYWHALKALYTWMSEEEIVQTNLLTSIARPKVPPASPKPADIQAIFTVLRDPRLRIKTRMMIMLGFLNGFRAGEIATVRGDVISPSGQITLKGKGGRIDTVPLHPQILKYRDSFPRHGYWFPSLMHENEPILAASVTCTIGSAFSRHGFHITAHQLRHAFATELVRKGVNMRTVQTLMRHSNLATTARYTQISIDQQQSALREITFPNMDPYFYPNEQLTLF